MTTQEKAEVIRVCGKDYDRWDVPAYIREREKKEHLKEFPLTGVICQECGDRWLWGIKDKHNKNNFICPMCEKEKKPKRRYSLYLKSHCDMPDFESECNAESKEEAITIFLRELNYDNPSPWDREMIEDEILVEN